MSIYIRVVRVCIPALPMIYCVFLSKVINTFVPHFPHLRRAFQQYLGKEKSREGQRGPSTLGRVLGVSPDFITPQLCDLGKFTSPFWALGSSPEKKL